MMRLIVFFILNFGALALGSWLMGESPGQNQWYRDLNKAPWTPQGWVFGFAWTTIMICFSIFMWKYTKSTTRNMLLIYSLFGLQWLLNIIWNPVFFYFHYAGIALTVIILLTLLVAVFTYLGIKDINGWGFLMLPYLLWLLIAISLNGYIVINNG